MSKDYHYEMLVAVESYALDASEKAVLAERARIVKAVTTIIRDACFTYMSYKPEPTWQDIIEKIEALKEGAPDDQQG